MYILVLSIHQPLFHNKHDLYKFLQEIHLTSLQGIDHRRGWWTVVPILPSTNRIWVPLPNTWVYYVILATSRWQPAHTLWNPHYILTCTLHIHLYKFEQATHLTSLQGVDHCIRYRHLMLDPEHLRIVLGRHARRVWCGLVIDKGQQLFFMLSLYHACVWCGLEIIGEISKLMDAYHVKSGLSGHVHHEKVTPATKANDTRAVDKQTNHTHPSFTC